MAERFDLTRDYDRSIDQGADFILEITFKDTADQPIDISSNSYDGDLKRTYQDAAAAASFTMTQPGGGTDGVLNVKLTKTETAAIAAGSYVYDIRETVGAVVTRILEGVAEVTLGVTTS